MKNYKSMFTFLICLLFIKPIHAEELPFGDKPYELKLKIENAINNYRAKNGHKIIAKGYFPGDSWDYFIILQNNKSYFIHYYIFDKKPVAEGPVIRRLKRQGKTTYWIVDSTSDRFVIKGGSVELWDHDGLIEKARVFNPN